MLIKYFFKLIELFDALMSVNNVKLSGHKCQFTKVEYALKEVFTVSKFKIYVAYFNCILMFNQFGFK